jgi:hypothetical protein
MEIQDGSLAPPIASKHVAVIPYSKDGTRFECSVVVEANVSSYGRQSRLPGGISYNMALAEPLIL